MQSNRKIYRTIAISCKGKDLLDEIARVHAINRGAFVEKLITDAYKKMFSEEK